MVDLEVIALGAHGALHRLRDRVDGMIVRYDAWFLVLLAVLMVLAFVMLAAMAIWCMTRANGRRFTGNWNWSRKGVSVWIECV